MIATYTIPQKQSNSGTIHDIASDTHDREIKFAKGCQYAVVNAAYYGGKGYTTHRTPEAAIKASRRNDYSHGIIGIDGTIYDIQDTYNGGKLVATNYKAS